MNNPAEELYQKHLNNIRTNGPWYCGQGKWKEISEEEFGQIYKATYKEDPKIYPQMLIACKDLVWLFFDQNKYLIWKRTDD